MKKNKRIPEIRFKGFTEEWEQRKFEDIFLLSQGLQIPISERFTENGDNRYFYITNEFLKDNCEEAYYIESPSESVICNEEDILMTRTGNTGIVVTDVSGCFHNNFFKIKYDKNAFSKRFICYLLHSPMMQKVILNSAGSSTIPDLSHNSFYKISAFFPQSKHEQDMVGKFLFQLDKAINLNQRKYEKLVNMKKSMLEKMFPKKISKVPQIRFKGFTEEWEQRKVGDFAYESSVKGNSGINAKKITVRLHNKGVEEAIEKTNGSDNTQYYIRRAGQFIYGKQNFFNGAIGIVPENLDKYESTKDVPAFDIDDTVNTKWFYYYIARPEIYKPQEALCTGTGSKRFHVNNFYNLTLFVPKMEEQIMIANSFEQIDNLITICQHKCEKLNNIKKSMLEKMFM